ncbi:ABC transporter permease [Lactiplantibacillus pentosus]|uniref:ABC transporter permease n=1 Tax=Lactiplantibacillus pentosus TaxID=1589 RepID=UPI000B5455BA|nr:ABC transporter permease [Lactiplantibacillus pentosus]ASG80600.1 ABC transporter permease [Lactiplantibacillus pentosus]MDO7805022.1 ABC transporter permease [Lactiplantibacillus pentosus]
MSTKVQRTTRYLLLDQLKLAGWSFFVLIWLFAVLPLLVDLLTGNLSHYSFFQDLASMNLGALFFLLIFIFGALTYDNFKLFIQNGISRRTYFSARLLSLILMSALCVIIGGIHFFAFHAPYMHWSTQQALLKTGTSLYAYAFGSNVTLNVALNLIFNWIFYIGTGLTGMACGTLLALFGKWAKTILIVGAPILGVIAIWLLTVVIVRNQSSFSYTGLEAFLKFLVGYPSHGPADAGYFNPVMPLITMLVGCGVIGTLAYLFNRKLRIRN